MCNSLYASLSILVLHTTATVVAAASPLVPLATNGHQPWSRASIAPQALYFDGYTYVSYQGTDDDPFVARFDHEAGAWDGPVQVGENVITNNDSHGSPAIVIDDQNRLRVFYGGHGSANNSQMRFAVADQPGSILNGFTEYTTGIDPTSTYSNAANFDNGGYVYFFRSGNHQADWVELTASGADVAYSNERSILQGNSQLSWYAHGYHDTIRDRYYVAASFHDEDEHSSGFPHAHHRYNMYVMYREADGNWYAMDGSPITAALPLDKQEADELVLAWESRSDDLSLAQGTYVNAPRMSLDRDGYPMLIAPAGQIGSNHYQHTFVRWNPQTETFTQRVAVTETGHFFQGSMVREHADGTLDAFVITSEPGVRGGDLQQWRSTDGGASWSFHDMIADSSTTGMLFNGPVPVQYGTDDAYLLFYGDDNGEQDNAHIFLYGDSGFVGPAGVGALWGDFSGDGVISLADWHVFRSHAFMDLSSLTPAEAYAKGDLDGDRDNDLADFLMFRDIYDQQNGAGAFDDMVAVVPEPVSLVLAMLPLTALFTFVRPSSQKSPPSPAT